MKSVRLNGEARQIAANTLPELAAELGLAPETLLVELNGTALHRSEWEDVFLKDGDQLEILRVAAGG